MTTSTSNPNFNNRELSWIEFNQRVLDQALDPSLPLLERAKFLAITASNLDEFFMVRVGGLISMHENGQTYKDPAGLTPYKQLTLIGKRIEQFVKDQYTLLNDTLLPALRTEGIAPLSWKQLSSERQELLGLYYQDHIFPVLTPLSYDEENPPYLPALQLVIALQLKSKDNPEPRIVFIPLPQSLGRRIPVPGADESAYILIEELVKQHWSGLFPGEKITSSAVFRVTRNGDVAVDEDDLADFAQEMRQVLVERRFSECVRLEIAADTSIPFSKKLREILDPQGVAKVYRLDSCLDLTWLMDFSLSSHRDDLKVTPWTPQLSATLDTELSVFENIQNGDILLNHPYESYETVVRFIEEAADDPNVIAIKQVLYRTARNSRIIAALIKAAQQGKQVTVLVELKARFDEAGNLTKAEDLRQWGVQVVYGVRGLKTHAKICLIVRREEGRIVRYCHFGTGNYNENTAKLYSDISLLTRNPDLGMDASLFFNAITGRSQIDHFRQLTMSPRMIKRRILDLVESEIRRAKHGEPARIDAKMNSLQDEEIITALAKAARAGVEVNLNIRGVCCLRPDDKKELKHMHIVSIVDRYLEHARIFSFLQGGHPQVYISSADWMTRNLDKRIELMIPVLNPALADRLRHILTAYFDDNQQAWEILPDGTGRRLAPSSPNKAFRAQEYFTREAHKAVKNKERLLKNTLVPHKPEGS